MGHRILQICFKYPPEYSGYGKQLHTVNSALLATGRVKRITVLTRQVSDDVSVPGLSVLGPSKRLNNVYAFSCWLAGILPRLVRSHDLVHCVKAGPESLVSALLVRALRRPIVVKVTRDEYAFKRELFRLNSWFRFVRAWVVARNSVMIALTPTIASQILAVNKNARIVEIPNGLDLSAYQSSGTRQRDDSVVRLTFLGSISRTKGVYDLVEALRNAQFDSPIEFKFAGPLYEPGWLDVFNQMRASSLRASDNLEYVGELQSVSTLLAQSDVAVLPSYLEGLPNALIEASIAGCAMVASAIPGNQDVIEDGLNGLLVPVGDVQALTKGLERVVNDRELRESMKEAAARTAERFDLRRVVDAYASLYDEMSST